MQKEKKFISPGAWFSMMYPASWIEAEDGEGTFLFYDPNVWSGNFRVSAYRTSENKREKPAGQESHVVEIMNQTYLYSKEEFHEGGHNYVTHIWQKRKGDLSFMFSFTAEESMHALMAEKIISSVKVREEGKKYPPELIPVRISEIYRINEAYEWVAQKIKKECRKEFQAMEADLPRLQQIIDKGDISAKDKEAWLSLGIAVCVILANEIEGFEWQTLIDGNREAPVLKYCDTDLVVDPMKLVWSRIRNGLPCLIGEEYDEVIKEIK